MEVNDQLQIPATLHLMEEHRCHDMHHQSDMMTNTKTGRKLDDTTSYRRNDMSENTLIDHQFYLKNHNTCTKHLEDIKCVIDFSLQLLYINHYSF